MRRLHLILALAFVWRLVISTLTPIPSEDGVSYLWMAERFAEGDFALALSEVFPPLLSLLTALPIALGADPFLAAQLVLGLGGSLAVLPIARATETLLPGGGIPAACLLAFSPLPIRFCAEVYTEPLFLLFGALALDSGFRQRFWTLGLWSGVAFWLRPEALVIPVASVIARPGAWPALLPSTALALALGLWRAALGLGYSPVAKLELILERSVFSDGVPVISFLQHLLEIPWLCVEAFGLAVPLATWGLLKNRRPGIAPLLWILLLGVVVICAFLPRRRFLVSWSFAVIPVAAMGLCALPRGARAPALWAVVAFGLALSLRTTEPNRIAEREVGKYLAARLSPGQQVSGDMTRVIYYAGRRPLTPRRSSIEELVQAALDPGVRYVVLGSRRASTPAVRQRIGAEYAPLSLPSDLEALADDRGILVLQRR